jgi:hypothetical protein
MKPVAKTSSIRRISMRTLPKWMLRASLFAVILAVMSMSPAIYAQESVESIEFNVPFAFEDGSQIFPPGQYTIQMESQDILLIRGASGSGLLLRMSDEDRQPSTTTKVVFRKYGDQYFVGEVWVEGETTHTDTVESKTEKRLASELAENKIAPTSVELAALGTSR